jgi:hypothetical protein
LGAGVGIFVAILRGVATMVSGLRVAVGPAASFVLVGEASLVPTAPPPPPDDAGEPVAPPTLDALVAVAGSFVGAATVLVALLSPPPPHAAMLSANAAATANGHTNRLRIGGFQSLAEQCCGTRLCASQYTHFGGRHAGVDVSVPGHDQRISAYLYNAFWPTRGAHLPTE